MSDDQKTSQHNLDNLLLEAVQNHKLTSCQYLLEEGANQDAHFYGAEQETLLMLSSNLNLILFEILLEYNPNLYHRDIDGNDILAYLIKNHNQEALEILLSKNRKVNFESINNDGFTPLEMCFETNSFYLANILIAYGAPFSENQWHEYSANYEENEPQNKIYQQNKARRQKDYLNQSTSNVIPVFSKPRL
jgi:ankyrin repeat protein